MINQALCSRIKRMKINVLYIKKFTIRCKENYILFSIAHRCDMFNNKFNNYIIIKIIRNYYEKIRN